MGKAAADPGINHWLVVIVNGAADGQDAQRDIVRIFQLRRVKSRSAPPIEENQVQAVCLCWTIRSLGIALGQAASLHPRLSTAPMRTSCLESREVRALRVRYPYLRIVFISSRTYGGYATTDLNPEPFAYESGFSVKWLIESQINEMRGLPGSPRAGTLDYVKKAAPLILWGPYLWADGATPRSDGLAWQRGDFEEDGMHPSQSGEAKVADRLIEFFKNSPYTRCWFVVGGNVYERALAPS